MRIILLGAPGSGKGTQAQFIMKKYGIPQISTGSILRSLVEEDSQIGKQFKSIIDTGKLITDELVISLVKKRIKQDDCRTGFLLDGFPRTHPQANAMKEAGIIVDYVLKLSVPDSFIINRIVGRRVHPSSGRVYHVTFSPPKQRDKDDITGEPLIIRKDDKEDAIYKRLLEYHQKTESLTDFYYKEANAGNTKYFTIDGTRNINEVSAELAAIIS